MSKQKSLEVEITSINSMYIESPKPVSGWGEDAESLTVGGKVAEVMVKKDGKLFVGLRILPDGSVILTNYDGYFTQTVERNLRLTNDRPWKEEPKSEQ